MTGEFDLESIFYLDLADRGLTDHRLGALPLCSSLCILHLQLNSLTSTAPLQTLTQLEELDLSVNRISSLEGCHKLVSLRKLCLAGNLIQDLDTMLVLSQLTHLRDLSLQLRDSELTNPVCASEGYSLFMRESFLGLVWLDGEKVSGPGAELYTLTEQTSRDETGSDEVKGMVSGHGKWLVHICTFYVLRSVHIQILCQTHWLSSLSVMRRKWTWSQVSHCAEAGVQVVNCSSSLQDYYWSAVRQVTEFRNISLPSERSSDRTS